MKIIKAFGFQYSDWSWYRSSEVRFVCSWWEERTCKIIDFTVPGGSKIEDKEKEDIKISRSKKGFTEDLEC